MKRYATLKGHVRGILDTDDSGDFDPSKWSIYPGPELPDIPTPYVLLTPYGGPGEDAEGALDQRAWQIRVCGHQMSWEDAEAVANAIDMAFLRFYTQNVGNERVTSIQRTGGSPAPLNVDDADRVHFVCSYIFGVGLGLLNQ